MPIPNRYYEAVNGWSASVLGTIAQQFGDLAGLLVMAAGAAAAAVLLWVLLPETKPAKYID